MVDSPKTPSESHQDTQRRVDVDVGEGLDAWLQALGAFLVYTATW